jgi:hypothetical protein
MHSPPPEGGAGNSGPALASTTRVDTRHTLRLTLAAAAAVALACGRTHEPRAEEQVLRLEVEKLRAQVTAAEAGKLLAFDQLLVVVDQKLVQQLLASAIPVEGDVGGGFHVAIDAAAAEFADGVALIHLNGAARHAAGGPSARIAVYAGLDVVELEPASGVLRARVSVYQVEVLSGGLGFGARGRRLTEALAEGGLESLVGPIEVPVRIEDRLRLPELRTRRVSVPALEVPVAASVSSVRVFGGKLWVSVRARLALPPDAPALAAPAAEAAAPGTS